MRLNDESIIPKYKQIKDFIVKDIYSDAYVKGHKLPIERAMAQELNVSRGTVKKTYEALAKDGFVDIVWGSGVFIGAKENRMIAQTNADIRIGVYVNELMEKGFTSTVIEKLIGIQVISKYTATKSKYCCC